MSKLLIRNTTANDITLETGFKIAGTESIVAPHRYIIDLAESSDLGAYLISGDLVINDGFSDLSSIEAIKYITISTQESLYFSNFPTGFVNKTDSVISFVNATRTFSIAPVADKFEFFMNGDKITKTSQEDIILPASAEGPWTIQYNQSGVLTSNQNLVDIEENLLVAALYWDEDNDISLGLAEERHQGNMSGSTRAAFHRTVNTTYSYGLDIGNYTLNGPGVVEDVQFTITDGAIRDEDNLIEIAHSDTPTNFFEQIIYHSTGLYASIGVFYKQIAGLWRSESNGTSPILMRNGKPIVNEVDKISGDWSLSEVPNNRFYAVWIAATSIIDHPVIAFIGQRYDLDLEYAQLYNNIQDYDFGIYPYPEIKLLYKLIFLTKISFSNAYKSILVDVSDVRRTGSERTVSSISPAVSAEIEIIRSGMNRQLANMMVNTLEIQTLKVVNYDPNLSYFVDSFNDADLLELESVNYHINEFEGYIELTPGGDFSAIDTTKSQFDDGVYTNTVSFISAGGDGEITKEKTFVGGVFSLEDFEDLSNVSTTGSAQQSQTSVAGTYYEGSYGLRLDVNFAAPSLTEEATTSIDFGVLGTDISSHKFLRLYYFKQQTGSINYTIELEDIYAATYSFTMLPLAQSYIFQEITKNITLVSGIDLTAIRYIKFNLFEEAAGQTLLEITVGNPGSESIYSTRSGKQSFKLNESKPCQRIRLRVDYDNGKIPEEPLYIAVSNVFGTTLGITSIRPEDASTTMTDFYLVFDNSFNLILDTTYTVSLQTGASGQAAWNVELLNASPYTDGSYFRENTDLGQDLNFSLYSPSISEQIYVDALKTEAESTYQLTGSFLSRSIFIGEIPQTLETVSWNYVTGDDLISSRIRFATTESGLTSASWSSYFTDSTGATNNLVGITPESYFQYEITWTGGSITSSAILEDFRIDYTVVEGSGSSTIISTAETTSIVPIEFVLMWQDDVGGGTTNYYVSRDGKTTWQSVLESEKGTLMDFTSEVGIQIHLKAILTGNAKLYGWAFACDQNFI